MYQYTKDDFDSILAFSSAINSDYASFENSVLIALATIFDQHLTAYTVFKLDAEGQMYVSRISSNSIPPEVIDRYKNVYYKKDPFLKKYSQLCAVSTASTYFTDESLDPGEFKGSEYAQFLSKFSIVHEAILGINDPMGNMINIIVYKYGGVGDFTEREKALFQYIGQVFNQSKALHWKNERQQRRLDAMCAGAEVPQCGIALVDSKGRLLFSNSLFMSYSARLSSGLSKEEVVKDVLYALLGEYSLPRGGASRQQTHIDGLCVSLQSRRAALAGRADELYILKIVKDSEQRAANLDCSALALQYGLTHREAEVLVLAAKGYNNQQIADELYIGVSTVKSHMGNVFGKLSVSSRAELMKKLRADSAQ